MAKKPAKIKGKPMLEPKGAVAPKAGTSKDFSKQMKGNIKSKRSVGSG